jgi:lipopolysaccharide transport protein LptA
MKISLLFVLLSLVPICAIAQKDPDFSQSIELSGDFLNLNLNSGNGVYKGNFIAKQGSMRIEGSEIQLKQKANKELDNIVASGNPVRFKKKNYSTGEIVSGVAKKITYDANKLLVTLEGNAEISTDQGKSFKSPIITYGLTTGEIEAKGNSQRRVQVVIPPNSTRESTPIVK